MLRKASNSTFVLVIASSGFSTSRWRDTAAGVGCRDRVNMATFGSWLEINLFLLTCLLTSIFSGTQVTKFVAFKFPRLILMMRWGRWVALPHSPTWGTWSALPWKFRHCRGSCWPSLKDVRFWSMHLVELVGLYTVLGSDLPPGRPWEFTMRNVKKWKLFSCLTYTEKTAKKTLFLAVKTKQKAAFSCQAWDVFIL